LDSSNALLEHIKANNALATPDSHQYLLKIADSLLSLLRKQSKVDRFVIPALKVISQLLSYGCFDSLQPPEFSSSTDLYNTVVYLIATSKDIVKIMASVYV
jgi:hypothetical protein